MPRSLEQLKQSSGTLSGLESQMLRTFCTSEYMQTHRDLNDDYGQLLQTPELTPLQSHFNKRKQTLSNDHSAAVQELYALRWGPTKIPIYNILLSFIYMTPHLRQGYLTNAEWLAKTIKVPPYMDIAFAQLMLDNGGDINYRNRYGGVVAQGFVKIYQYDAATVERSSKALKWFLENGGDVGIKDGDGYSARYLIDRLEGLAPQLKAVLTQFEQHGTGGDGDEKATNSKTGRNDPCPCGSSKKFKKCCG